MPSRSTAVSPIEWACSGVMSKGTGLSAIQCSASSTYASARIDVDEWLSPLVYHMPAQLLVLHMAARAGIPHIPMRRHDDTWLIAKGIVRDRTQGLA